MFDFFQRYYDQRILQFDSVRDTPGHTPSKVVVLGSDIP